jgi:hypothetical protein
MRKNKVPQGYKDKIPKGYRYIPDNSEAANKKILENLEKKRIAKAGT